MSKVIKVLMMSMAVCLGFALLAGCGNSEEPQQVASEGQSEAETIDLANVYDLSDVRKITVDGITSKGDLLFEITDPADIEKMVDAVDFASWKETEPLSAAVFGHIRFDDDITISVSGAGADGEPLYGGISQVKRDENGELVAVDPPASAEKVKRYRMPYSIYSTMMEMAAKYKPEMLDEK